MGILDNEYVRLVLSGSPFMQRREENMRADELGARYTNLLDAETGAQMGPPSEAQMGRQMLSQGGLLGDGPRGPGADFFTRAAGIPGYQSLAGGAQANLGAMDRARYQNDWSVNNVPLADTLRMGQQSAQWGADYAQRQNQFDNLSAAQKAQIEADKARAAQAAGAAARAYDLDLRKFNAQYGPGTVDRMNPYGLKGTDLATRNMEFGDRDLAASIAQDVAKQVQDWTVNGGKFTEPARASAVGKAWQLAVMPLMTELNKSGVVNGQELPRLIGLMGDPAKWVNLSDKDRMQVEIINDWMQKRRVNFYQAHGMAPGPLPESPLSVGQARGANAGHAPSAQGRPYTPPGQAARQGPGYSGLPGLPLTGGGGYAY
jgi:hypothetical protein